MSFELSPQHHASLSIFKRFSESCEKWGLLSPELSSNPWLKLDLSNTNHSLKSLDLSASMAPLGDYIVKEMEKTSSQVAYGGWQEERYLYQASPHFDKGTESRSIHLGLDLWVAAGSPILCPYEAKIHSFQDNNNFLDYGPTIILEHSFEEIVFYSLYGHLSRSSLIGKSAGQTLKKGEVFATLGSSTENGEWPPHLHFQIILDLLGKIGDFPGVSSKEDRNFFAALCPEPYGLLGLVG